MRDLVVFVCVFESLGITYIYISSNALSEYVEYQMTVFLLHYLILGALNILLKLLSHSKPENEAF